MLTNDTLTKPRGASHRAASRLLRAAPAPATSPQRASQDTAVLAEARLVPKGRTDRPWRSALATPSPDDELSLDPSEVHWLMEEHELTAEEVRDLRWQGLL